MYYITLFLKPFVVCESEQYLKLRTKGKVESLSKALAVCTALWCLYCTRASDMCAGPRAHARLYLTVPFLATLIVDHRIGSLKDGIQCAGSGQN